jgi:TolA-binding protein
MRNTLRLLVLALVAGPAFSPAQKKDDILEIQRDVADLAEKVRTLQKSQDDKLEALRLLVQQATTASTQVTQDMTALQRTLTNNITTTLSDQQGKISLAVAPLGSQMDALATSVNALTQTVGQMNVRMGQIDSKLKDLSDKVSILNQPAPAPPPSVVVPSADPNAPPPGTTRLGLRQDAEKDYASGNDELALKEFANYIKYFHDDEYAPNAGYMIGMVYLQHQKDYESAAEAFQKVIDTFPGMNKSQDALFQKARALELGGHKTEAIKAFNEFVKSYPANDYAPQARLELNKLAPPANKSKGRGASK